MSDLPEFLLARIAEDEAVARAAEPGPWQAEPYWFDGAESADVRGPLGRRITREEIDAEDATHIARWDPTRVLAECKAKRAIVETHQLVEAHIRTVALTNPDEARDARNTRAGLQAALQALALPYVDHPNYREEWRP